MESHPSSLLDELSIAGIWDESAVSSSPLVLMPYMGMLVEKYFLLSNITGSSNSTVHKHIPDITGHYDYGKVCVSFVVSFFGAYLATSLCEQLRAHYLHGKNRSPWIPVRWFVLMGFAFGGINVWAMHFIGMCAFTLYSDIRQMNVPTYYNVPLSVGTMFIVTTLMSIGVAISSYDPLFMKTKGEILEMFIKDTSQFSMTEIRKIKNVRLFRIIATQSLGYLFTGALVAASGILAMHYIGMEGLHFTGWWEYNPEQVLASVVIAVVAAVIAFWVLFRLLSLFPNKEILRVVCSLFMAIAVCGMHYMAMHASRIQYSWHAGEASRKIPGYYIPRLDAYYPILVFSIISIGLISIYLMIDLRSVVHRFYGRIDLRDEVLIGADIPGAGLRHAGMHSGRVASGRRKGSNHGHHNEVVPFIQALRAKSSILLQRPSFRNSTSATSLTTSTLASHTTGSHSMSISHNQAQRRNNSSRIQVASTSTVHSLSTVDYLVNLNGQGKGNDLEEGDGSENGRHVDNRVDSPVARISHSYSDKSTGRIIPIDGSVEDFN